MLDSRHLPSWRRWGWVTAVSLFLINLIGFIDAETGSALGCGANWPLCNGRIIPALTSEHVVIEFSHRFLVAVGGLLAIVYLALVWRRFRALPQVLGLAAVGIGFIVIQSVMGALAVLFVNPPPILAFHLGFGLMAMGAAVLIPIFLGQMRYVERQYTLPPRARTWIWGLWVYLYAAIYLGSYVAFRDAGPACAGWPLCPAGLPPWNSLAALDLAHRVLAVGLLVMTGGLWYRLARDVPERADLRSGARVLLALVLAQMVSGAALVWSHIALWAYTIHVALVMCLFAAASYLVLQTWRAPSIPRAVPDLPVPQRDPTVQRH